MYTLRSHISAVKYTCAFHRPTTTKSSKSQSSSLFITFPKEFRFQGKTSQNSIKLITTIFRNHKISIQP